MKKIILISALLITACQSIEEANTKLYAGMDRKSFCKAFWDSALIDPCSIYDNSRVVYFPAYKTEILPSHSAHYENSDTKMYWYVFENVNQISPITYHEYFDYAEPGENPGNLVMVTDNYQEAEMVATNGRIYGVKRVTMKPLGKRQETLADTLIEAAIEGVAEGLVDGLVEKAIGCDEDVRVRHRTRSHPLGERNETIVYKEDC